MISSPNPEKAYSKFDLINDLRSLGIEAGDRIIVHSSMKSLGKVEGGVKTVIQALIDVITPAGTILFPTFNKRVEAWAVGRIPPSTGALPFVFMHQRDVVQSVHPTHSVAVWGDGAENIIAGHFETGALSVDSPMHRIAKLGGKILGIGVDFKTLSLIHVAESIAKLPYLSYGYAMDRIPPVVTLPDGSKVEHHPKEYPGDSKAFVRVQEIMRKRGLLTEGRLCDAESYVASGKEVLDVSLEFIEQDPAALLCDNESCSVCPTRRKILRDAGMIE